MTNTAWINIEDVVDNHNLHDDLIVSVKLADLRALYRKSEELTREVNALENHLLEVQRGEN